MRHIDTLMWAEACAMIERAERLRRQFFLPAGPGARGPSWEPPIDVFETDGELWIVVALPGVDPARLDVSVEDGMLIVAGERTLPAEARRASILRLEVPLGRFERRIELPAGRYQVGRRDLANGCLTLSLRRLAR
jgi:HSP20 family molecular chaperone IbpA